MLMLMGESVPGSILFLDIDGVLNGHEQDSHGYCRIQPGPVVHLNRILAEIGEPTEVSLAP